jgi:hypothetical protein
MAEREGQGVASPQEAEALAKPPQGAQRRRYWQEHVERWHSSGMTQKDYCRKNRLKWSAFYYWRKRLQELSAPVSLVQVSLAAGRPGNDVHGSPGLVLLIGTHYRVQIGDEFSPATLARLVHTLVQLS